jgi:hypothetical protein
MGEEVRIFLILALFGLTGCLGLSSKDNELIGQVKKVKQRTPLICPDRVDVDISLGVIRNGVGSMSAEDVWMTVESADEIAKFKKANETGSLVKVKYDVRRVIICGDQNLATHVEITQ